MAKAIGYVRVSSQSQVDDGVSLDAQQAKIEAYCMLNDLELVATHTDAGLSGGRSDNRPALQDAIKQACKSKAVLVVYSMSRLARSTRDTLEIADALDQSGADLVSLSEKIDTTSASGKMVFRLMAVLAEFERDQISERTTMALHHMRSKGERTGQIPFGFNLSADGIQLVPNPSEQDALQVMRAMRLAGDSYRTIGAHLVTSGVLTKRGGVRWDPRTVKSVLDTAITRAA